MKTIIIKSITLALISVIILLMALPVFSQNNQTGKIAMITNSTDMMGWTLLFLGWLLYWGKKLKEMQLVNKGISIKIWIATFFLDNLFEIPISLGSCIALVLLAPYIPSDVIDLHGKLSLFLVGFGGGSLLNGLITQGKNISK